MDDMEVTRIVPDQETEPVFNLLPVKITVMKMRYLIPILFVMTVCIVTAGCSQSSGPKDSGQVFPATSAPTQKVSGSLTTPADLTILVNRAATYARENGREKATAAFNDPNGPFMQGEVYVFAEAYDGTALAEPFHHELVETNVKNMTDRYGVHLYQNMEETGRYGIGFVSYDYPNPARNNRIEPKFSVVSDVDGTYYVGAGTYAGSGIVFPSAAIGPATREYTITDLTAFVRQAVAYARANGKEKTVAAFGDTGGQFSDGELDTTGTGLQWHGDGKFPLSGHRKEPDQPDQLP